MLLKCRCVSTVNFPLKRRILFSSIANEATRFQASHLGYESATYSTRSHISNHFISSGLKLAAKFNLLRQSQLLHAYLIKFGIHNGLSLQNQVLKSYVKCRRVLDSRQLFDDMLVRDVISWNIVISGRVWSDCNMGFWYFRMMLLEPCRPDWITLTSLLRLCVDVNEAELSIVLHCFIIKFGFSKDCRVSSALIDTYGKLGLVGDARQVFDYVEERDLVLWNVMISSYSMNFLMEEEFKLWNIMRKEGLKGDDFTFTSLLNSCACFGYSDFGEGIHGIIVKLCFNWDVVVASSLVHMYAKNKKLMEARKAFDMMPFRNVISWTTMIVGYGQCGDGIETIKLLNQMFREDFHPDELTLSSVLSSCGNLALFNEISQVHAYASKNGLSEFLSLSNALITAYFKCGSISCASRTFFSIPAPDLVSWTSIIGAYAFHGLPKEATEIFERMLFTGIRPDKIAFLEVLSACSHGGLLKKGLHYYRLMLDVYKIAPDLEHYTCLVDLFGRVGLLKEAFDVLTSALQEHGGCDGLGAFLGACKVHGNTEFTKWAVEKLLTLEPNKPVNYRLISNLYALSGSWFNVAHTRKSMRENCGNKAPGCSWIHIAGKVCTFISGDKSHPQHTNVSFMLGLLHSLIKDTDGIATHTT